MPSKKKTSTQAAPFLKTAAEAIGTALGKLAVKTGVATPSVSSQKKRKAPVATKKKGMAPKRKAVKESAR